MVNVQFDDPNIGLQDIARRQRVYRGIIGFLVNKGWAKDEKMANVILVSVIILCLIIITFAASSAFGGSKPQRLNPEEIQQMKHLPKPR